MSALDNINLNGTRYNLAVPTAEMTQTAVNEWLDEHPEATTTVEDGAITDAKLSAKLKLQTLINLSNMAYGENIVLPIATSYAEGAVYLNGYYYVACRDYSASPARTYIAKYDRDMTYVTYTYADAQYGVANNIWTDGTDIYVDYDNGYHAEYTASFTLVKAKQTNIRNMGYWDGKLYGITIGATSARVAVLDTDWETPLDYFDVALTQQTLQSATIIDGIFCIATTYGLFQFIDIATESLLAEIPYFSGKEIENFFVDPDGVKCCGHYYGANGVFNIGTFSGIDNPTVQYVPIDGRGNYNILHSAMASNVYKVTYGTSLGLPQDDGDLFVFGNTRIFINTDDNCMYAWNGTEWREFGGTVTSELVNVNIGTSQKLFIKKAGSNIYIKANISVTAGAVTSGNVIATLAEKYRPTWDTLISAVARNATGWAAATYVPCVVQIKTNGQVSIVGNQTQLDTCAYFVFETSYFNV